MYQVLRAVWCYLAVFIRVTTIISGFLIRIAWYFLFDTSICLLLIRRRIINLQLLWAFGLINNLLLLEVFNCNIGCNINFNSAVFIRFLYTILSCTIYYLGFCAGLRVFFQLHLFWFLVVLSRMCGLAATYVVILSDMLSFVKLCHNIQNDSLLFPIAFVLHTPLSAINALLSLTYILYKLIGSRSRFARSAVFVTVDVCSLLNIQSVTLNIRLFIHRILIYFLHHSQICVFNWSDFRTRASPAI